MDFKREKVNLKAAIIPLENYFSILKLSKEFTKIIGVLISIFVGKCICF